MQIAVHIAFYYNESRIQYLNRVLTNLNEIGTSNELNVYIHCNRKFSMNQKFGNINTETVVAKFFDVPKLRGFYRHLPYKLRQHVDPLYLSWNHRKYVLDTIDDYDVQIYLDDDADFTSRTLQYWLTHKSLCNENGYNLGFLRIEFDERANKWFCTDLTWSPSRLIRVGDRLFARSTHFYGFWIYDKAELRRFAESERWYPRHGEGVIERAELGWHADYLGMYNCTIIPVKTTDNNTIMLDEACGIHHMPNNYIGHSKFCTLEFPPRVISE
jgi:hypothetical protein